MSQSALPVNRLIHESSPYLRQHAHNPVDWYPWGAEALQRARELDRPIFLSIGYSACHWCHVMERESFENDEIAAILNQHFVSIKVDREERPDLDTIYMTAVQLLTGQGGWPMTVFLTPSLEPFTGGTYFPPDDRYGRPGFKRVLLALVEYWTRRRDEVNQAAAELTKHVRSSARFLGETVRGPLDAAILQNAVAQLRRAFDPVHGGFGRAPKFPHPMDLRFLLRAARRLDDADALHMARHTLDRMASGGIYDHLGGGFARYSTDARWLVPHFEKMLYDNALLVPCYLELYQVTGEPSQRAIVEETLAWVAREMTSPEGPFYSTLDADSEGEEGKFYVWSSAEIEQVLGQADADLFSAVYGVEPDGSWEGHNILHRTKTWEQAAALLRVPADELQTRMREARAKLFAAREPRVRPGLDDKVLTSWNALMIAALAQAAQVLDEPAHASAAARAAEFLLTRLRTADGRLLRTWSAGQRAKLNAYLDDYAYLIDALVTLYEATFEPRWIASALELADVMLDQFWDSDTGGFFYTGRDHETLLTRTKDVHDNATPAGNAMAVIGLLRLAKLTGRGQLQERAEATLRLHGGLLSEHPSAVGQMLCALDFYLGPVREFAVVGDAAADEVRRVLRALRGRFEPNRVVAWRSTNPAPELDALIPLLAGKSAIGPVTTYVCENFTCQAPLVGVEAVEKFSAR